MLFRVVFCLIYFNLLSSFNLFLSEPIKWLVVVVSINDIQSLTKSNLAIMLVTWNKRVLSNDFKVGGERGGGGGGGGNGDLVQ